MVHMTLQLLWFQLLRTPKIIRAQEKVVVCYDMKAQVDKEFILFNLIIIVLGRTYCPWNLLNILDLQKTTMIDVFLFSFRLVYCQQRECIYIYHVQYKLMVMVFDHVISSNVTYILACFAIRETLMMKENKKSSVLFWLIMSFAV